MHAMVIAAPAATASVRATALGSCAARQSSETSRLTANDAPQTTAPNSSAMYARDDESIASAGDQAGHARRHTDGRRRSRAAAAASHSDSDAGQPRDRGRSPRFPRRPQHEAIDAGVEIAERAELLAQLVDFTQPRIPGGVVITRILPATNADSSRRRSARRPNGASARSAV